jgi:hypothetical protein
MGGGYQPFGGKRNWQGRFDINIHGINVPNIGQPGST